MVFDSINGVDYGREVKDAKTYEDIASLFKKLFGIGIPTDPAGYKKNGSDYGLKVRGVRAREKLNEQCKAILARVTDPSQLTPEDREILLQYSGKGGLTDNSQWEYYTPTRLAQGIWGTLKAHGFSNGNVLEPSCGAGVFIGTKPAGVVMTANDLDEVGSGIARLLNPNDFVTTSPFEDIVMSTKDDTFDSCVGNVPFGKTRGGAIQNDPAYKNEVLPQAYFILRILDKIKPGGLACLVVSTDVIGDKDSAWKRRRIEISKRAEFLGAHKLPSSMFGGRGGQGTSAVTDVIVLRKHSRVLLDKLRNEEIATETLKEAKVYWDEFISGEYWLGEGKPFIMGKFVPRDPNKARSRARVEGNIDDETLKRNLAKKFHSRIDWNILNDAEPILRNYVDGDRRFINNEQYELVNGEWQKVKVTLTETEINKKTFGVESVEDLEALLYSLPNALNQTVEQAYATLNAYPQYMTTQQKEAVAFAMSQCEDVREQVYRGALLGSMLAKMNVDEQNGEDVSLRRKNLQEAIVAEIDKYGHPANNSNFTILGQSSRTFGMFMSAVDVNGKFSDLLLGTLDKSKAKGYNEDNLADIVSYLSKTYDGQVEIEDVQNLYKGSANIESIVDLADIDEIAITPEGMFEPMVKYCSGDLPSKIAELTTAINNTDDEKLQTKFRKQIDRMNALIPRVPVEDITFGLQNKWFSKKFILDFLRQNGYPKAQFGKMVEIEKEDWDGEIRTVKEFVDDPEIEGGQFYILGYGNKKPDKYPLQLQKYLNGDNIKSNTTETATEYRRDTKLLEENFDAWMKQLPESDDLAAEYSLKFNGFVDPVYDTDKLDIDDIISGEIIPHAYQNAEVRRLSEQGSGICGFGTGLGKSFTALAMAGYNFKHGRAKRTCIVVPSSVLENWYHEANTFYSQKYMRSNVLFVGLEPKLDKEGGIIQRPILDENGKPKIGKNGQPVMQDIVRFVKSKNDIYEAMWKIPQSNFSLVVMTKEKFQSIPVRPETMKTYTDDMVSRHLLSDKDAKDAIESSQKKRSYNDDVKKNSLEGKFSDQGGKKKGELPYLEDMGFDSIITDESHFFKNSLSRGEKTGNIVGVPSPNPAGIAVDMSIKCDWLRRNNNGRGVYGLTATPVTNSPIEVFNMLSLVAPKEDFERMGVRTVDDFVRQFGAVEERDRTNVSNDIVRANTLIGFKNLQGLRNFFNKYVNIKTVEDVDDEIHVPNAVEKNEEVEISEQQEKIYADLRDEARESAKNPYAPPEERGRSIFSIMRDMDRCTTDLDLYKRQITFVFARQHKEAMEKLLPTLPTQITIEEVDETTDEKVKVTYDYEPEIIDNGGETFSLVVHEQHEDAVLKAMADANISENDTNHPLTPKYAKLIENLKIHLDAGGKQIVFTEEKTQHRKIKRILVHNLPVEEAQVAIINAEDAAGSKLDAISKAYNAGSVKIVIANKKAEVGVNLQKGTTAIHHLTLPWTPASINQRNGRGVRQGNKVASVDIYYYSGKGTFDTYRKQLLQSKANWIGQLLMGKAATAANADIESQEEMAAMVAGTLEEYRAKKAKAEAERKDRAKAQYINRLRILVSVKESLASLEDRRQLAKDRAQSDIEEQKKRIVRYEQNNKGEETVKRAKEGLEKLKAKAAAIDKKYDDEKVKLEAQMNMNVGMLKAAAKNGELPFDESLIDHPENCIVSMKGEMYAIGEFLEDESGNIYKITRFDQQERRVYYDDVINGYPDSNFVDKLAQITHKCSYSESEINLKKLILGDLKYTDLLSSGITKQQFLENLDNIKLSLRDGAVVTLNGSLRLVPASSYLPDDDMRYVWPDVNDEDFRKQVFTLYLQYKRQSLGYKYSSLLMSMFGTRYEDMAVSFGNSATETQINDLVAEVYKTKLETMLERYPDFFKQLSKGWGNWHMLESGVYKGVELAAAQREFDNTDAFENATKMYLEAKHEEAKKIGSEQIRQEEREEEERLRADPNFKEVSPEAEQKLKEMGLTAYYNTETATLAFKGKKDIYEPYHRLFFQDLRGVGGYLYRVKESLKTDYKAKFTKAWAEHSGAWWHVDASYDIMKILKDIEKWGD